MLIMREEGGSTNDNVSEPFDNDLQCVCGFILSVNNLIDIDS